MYSCITTVHVHVYDVTTCIYWLSIAEYVTVYVVSLYAIGNVMLALTLASMV